MTGMALATARCHAGQPPVMALPRTLVESARGVVEAHLGQVPGEAGQVAGADAVGPGGDHDQAHVLGLLGADGDQVVAGGLAVEHVGLGAVEAQAVAVDRGGEAHVALVPAVVALGDGGDQAHLAAGDAGQPVALLLLGAALEDGQRGQHGGGQVRAGHGAAAQLLEEHPGVGERASFAAVLLGDEDAQPAGGGQPAPGLQGRGLVGGGDLQQRLLGVFGRDEAAGGRLQHFLFGGQRQVHILPQ